MILYNLYLVLNDELITVYDKANQRIVYEGSSEEIPEELMCKSVHDVTMVHEKDNNRPYLLINLN